MVFIWNRIDYEAVADKKFEENAADFWGYVVVHRLLVSALSPNHTKVKNCFFEVCIQFKQLIFCLISFV